MIGVPMYNYAMPSTLKAWLDQVHVRGVTSPHEEHAQPLRGRLAVIVSTRGTVHGPERRTSIATTWCRRCG